MEPYPVKNDPYVALMPKRWKNGPQRLFCRNGCEFDSEGANKYELSTRGAYSPKATLWPLETVAAPRRPCSARHYRCACEGLELASLDTGPFASPDIGAPGEGGRARRGRASPAFIFAKATDKRCDTRRAIVHQRNGQGKD